MLSQENLPKRHHHPECVQHSGKRDCPPELIRGSQGSGRNRPALEGSNQRNKNPENYPTKRHHTFKTEG